MSLSLDQFHLISLSDSLAVSCARRVCVLLLFVYLINLSSVIFFGCNWRYQEKSLLKFDCLLPVLVLHVSLRCVLFSGFLCCGQDPVILLIVGSIVILKCFVSFAPTQHFALAATVDLISLLSPTRTLIATPDYHLNSGPGASPGLCSVLTYVSPLLAVAPLYTGRLHSLLT